MSQFPSLFTFLWHRHIVSKNKHTRIVLLLLNLSPACSVYYRIPISSLHSSPVSFPRAFFLTFLSFTLVLHINHYFLMFDFVIFSLRLLLNIVGFVVQKITKHVRRTVTISNYRIRCLHCTFTCQCCIFLFLREVVCAFIPWTGFRVNVLTVGQTACSPLSEQLVLQRAWLYVKLLDYRKLL